LVKLVGDVLGRPAILDGPQNRLFAEEQRLLSDRATT
jgi:hypothetical protein